MRTTVRLDDSLLSEAKQRAAAERTTLTALIEESLRRMLASRSGERRSASFELRRSRDSSTREGVDLDDSRALRELMDGLR
ncbi:MAG: type II toxin-antitoxin system VapB family antitoxin [Solirubrobacteraceae bacterium]